MVDENFEMVVNAAATIFAAHVRNCGVDKEFKAIDEAAANCVRVARMIVKEAQKQGD
jgi:hypothetical protein